VVRLPILQRKTSSLDDTKTKVSWLNSRSVCPVPSFVVNRSGRGVDANSGRSVTRVTLSRDNHESMSSHLQSMLLPSAEVITSGDSTASALLGSLLSKS
jgi:hypothetical protein